MKATLEKLGGNILLVALPLAILAALFKLFHLPFANPLLLVGLSTVIIGALIKYCSENTLDGYLTGAAVTAACLFVLFKLMHWSNLDIITKVAIGTGAAWAAKTFLFSKKQEENDSEEL